MEREKTDIYINLRGPNETDPRQKLKKTILMKYY